MAEFLDLDDVRVWSVEAQGRPRGGLIVIHEIWGLVDHARNVADRFAAQGYHVMAPDLLSDAGTTPELGEELQAIMGDPDEERRLAAQPRLRAAFGPVHSPEFGQKAVRRLMTVVDALEGRPGVDGRIGVVGFCFGGTYAFELAAADPRVRGSAPFYGGTPKAPVIERIGCPVLAIYGAEDTALMDALPGLEREMDDAGVDFTAKVYENAGHAFFNDQNRRQYRPEAAADAWRLTLDFLARTIGQSRGPG